MKNIIFLLLVLLNLHLYAKEVKVGFYESTSPYTFQDKSGIVFDIVTEAFAYKNHTVVPIFANMSRSIELFKDGYVDTVSIATNDKSVKNVYYSESFMAYPNVIFALKSNNFKVKTLDDLKKYNLIGFQNATSFISKEFEKVTGEMGKKYSETSDQKKQTNLLLQGRIDFIVLDKYIFEYYKNQLVSKNPALKKSEIDAFDILEPVKHSLLFKDKALMDDFHEGLTHLIKTQRYKEIYNKYLPNYFEIKRD